MSSLPPLSPTRRAAASNSEYGATTSGSSSNSTAVSTCTSSSSAATSLIAVPPRSPFAASPHAGVPPLSPQHEASIVSSPSLGVKNNRHGDPGSNNNLGSADKSAEDLPDAVQITITPTSVSVRASTTRSPVLSPGFDGVSPNASSQQQHRDATSASVTLSSPVSHVRQYFN